MNIMASDLTRRGWLALASAAVGTIAPGSTTSQPPGASGDEPFGYCLNTSTIRGQNLSIVAEAEIAAKAGYRGIEPWVRELDEYVKNGGSLNDLGRQLRALGLSVESVIGFFEWAVDDESRRKKGLDEAKRNMELLREIGGSRLAAPPVGLTDRADFDPKRLAERYRVLLELGDTFGVVPQAEVWGFSKTLGTLAEAAHVAIAADNPKACILADVYHLYKGGSGFGGLRLLSGDSIHVFHMNDYPADPPRSTITDADRVYPGDGIAPLATLFRDLRAIGFRGMLSIELFNRAYWKEDASTVAETALRKLRAVVKKSLAGS
jgi:sugar phosphate isomerase/epimerase